MLARAESSEVTGTASSVRDFERQVRDALLHLYDVPYLLSHPLVRSVLGQPTSRHANPGKDLQGALLDAIEALGPTATSGHRGERSHLILRLRYVEALGATDVQARLGVSQSEYHRIHGRALGAVASLLAERWHVARPRLEQPPPRLAPLAASRRPATNLPCALTRFVGRQHELDRIAAWLRDPAGPRLVTLTGPGGCGKTRLALEIAPQVAEIFTDGIWLVELGAASEPAHVPAAVARVLGLPNGPAQSAIEAMKSHLANRRVLVVLDNCEHLVAASAALADTVLRACPGVRILATSREGLGTDGEVLSRVPPLAMPHPAVTAPQQIATYDAIRLFVDRARDAHPAFELTDLNAGAVVEICRHLDGIPLAIELAATRLAVLSVRQIADRLDDRFRVLTGGSRTALPRQQTLRASVDWSYDLLNETERTLLNRSSVFAEGFTLEAAEAVCADAGDRSQTVRPSVPCSLSAVPRQAVLDVVTRLVDKSVVVAREQGGVTWYRLLETIRQYAAQKLLASGEAALLHNRHWSWCLASGGRAKG